MPWGAHFCQFYQTKQDLLDVLVPYFKVGLENNEFCVWVTSEFLTKEEALAALKKAVPGFSVYLKKGQIEIFPYTDWYLKEGKFELKRVLGMWVAKHDEALARGYDGLRVSGNPFWIDNKKDWDDFTEYEAEINNVIDDYKILVLCTYSLEKCGANEIIDVVATHQFALIKREGKWELIEHSEHEKIEEALRRSEERYRSLFNGMTEGFALHEIICDNKGVPRDYRFLEINPAFERLTGLKREDVVGKTHNEVLPNDDPSWATAFGAVALTGEPVHFENYSPALKRYYEVFAYRPAPRQFAVILMDITERKKKEEELVRLNRTLRAISNSNQVMMRATDESQYLNDLCKIIVEDCGHTMVWIGFAQKDEGRTVKPVAWAGFEEGYLETLRITWADTERGRGPTGTAIRTGQTVICRNMLTDPKFVPWREQALKRGYQSSIALPLMAADKAFGALMIYSKDVDPFSEDEVRLLTELAGDLAYGITTIRLRNAHAQAEEALRHAEVEVERARLKALNTVADGLAHEITNPMNAMALTLQFLQRLVRHWQEEGDQITAEVIKEHRTAIVKHVGSVYDELMRVKTVVHDFRNFARPITLQQEETSLKEMLNQSMALFEQELKAKGVGAEVHVPETDIKIWADKTRLQQVFTNLIKNAMEAMDGGGKLVVSAEVRGDKAEIRFRDNGCGIPPENLAHLWEPYFSTKSGGSGLGLFICKNIVEAHMGNINVQSAPGAGTECTVAVPLSKKS
jgi:PAS domain S-box-containing protein